MKRGNDNSQLRADEVESLNDEESEERGSMKRASAEVLATRKIFKTKSRPSDFTPSATTPAPFAFGATLPAQPKLDTSIASSGPASANPFSGFSGLVTKAVELPKVAPAANPFSGFQGLSNTNTNLVEPSVTQSTGFGGFSTTPAESNTTTNSFSFGQTKPTVAATTTPAAFSFAPSAAVSAPAFASALSSNISSGSSAVSTGGESEYKKKMRKLNNSFLNWTNRQINEHPLSIWKDGVKDYIKYTSELSAKYGASDNAVSSSNTVSAIKDDVPVVKAVVAAPVPAAVSFGGFGSTPAPVASTTTAPAPPASNAFSITPAPIVFGAPFAAPVASSSGFSFAPPATVAPAATPAPFSFGASSAAPGSSFSSSFAFPSAAPATVVPTASSAFGGFGSSFPPLPAVASSFSLPSNNFSFAPAAGLASSAAAAGDDEGGDDEGEPILEPEKVLRDANDTDIILLDVPCKLYGYSKAGNEWKDTGKGSFRVTKAADSNKQRMLVRNPIGKLTFNAGFYKGMKIEKVKGGVKFNAFVVTDEPSIGGAAPVAPKPELKGFMVKLKEENVAKAMTILEAGVASCE